MAHLLPLLVGGIGAYRARKGKKLPPPIPMPDFEELQKQKRRKATPGTGRASTILTETDGLGG